MKYIKNGKLVLDGTIRECDLQDKLNKALEIIVDKLVDIAWLRKSKNCAWYNRGVGFNQRLKRTQYELVKEIIG